MAHVLLDEQVKRAVIQRVTTYPLRIPLRSRVEHAAAQRAYADPVVVCIEFQNGVLGYGESVARPYVTGETADSVVEAIEQVFTPTLLDFHPTSFPEALAFIDGLAFHDSQGRRIFSARGAVEMALLDATMQCFNRGVEDVTQWMGMPGFGSPGSVGCARFSGVLATASLERLRKQLRKMYWGGLRCYKLKVGFPDDHLRMEKVVAYLRGPLASGRVRLRVDANSQWGEAEIGEAMAWLGKYPIEAVEQPVARGQESLLLPFRGSGALPIVHDESLVDMDDAKRLISLGVADHFNIRISKCGGLMPSLRLAAFARREGVGIQLGCMVGETSLLSIAGLSFLRCCPDVKWAEGCYGRRLLQGDIVPTSLKFGYGGRWPLHSVDLDGNRPMVSSLEKYCCDGQKVVMPL